MDNFLIVGLGASAGGIQSFKEFFEHVPGGSGMAYVAILHLSPDHDSQLAQVLQQTTTLPVTQVTERVQVQPDHVYVIPPNQHLSMEGGHIAVTPNLAVEERRAPVDIFFRSLAESHGPAAVCVVLSGTGANGSMGLKRVKEKGGAAFVQNPREAEFNEMPRNAIATGFVDEILNVADIPARILAYKERIGAVQIPVEAKTRADEDQLALREIFTQLRRRTGHDFSNYKRPTLLRRIERRINVRSLPDLPAYAAFIAEHPEETHALLKDLLISVTNFFRDKAAFEELEMHVLPKLFAGKTAEQSVRIWAAGCATGEEAYTIAMLCAERVEHMTDAPKVQIFATDIDESVIAQARDGFYTLNDAADVSPERLRRFFNKEGNGFRIRREIRETILFAQHNFLKDPPFSRLDLITCRNVMIYLNNAAQDRVMETFHFVLNPGGYLMLGTAESVEGASDLYTVVSREQHIYQSRQVGSRRVIVPESTPQFRIESPAYQLRQEQSATPQRISFGELHQRLLEQYAPPSLVVNEEYDIVHVSEQAGRYLQVSGGELSQNLLKLIREELRLELRSALYQSVQRQIAVDAPGLKVHIDDRTETVNIHVRPVLGSGDLAKGYILVVFESVTTVEDEHAPVVLKPDEPIARHLEQELVRLKAQLRSSNEQHELGAEELKASNEELQAMNEELRSAAEELETSKEELQSINEELITVNQELKIKVEEASTMGNNLQNLINSTAIGTIFLNRSFRVMLFTPAAREVFNLIEADYGRLLSDITNRFAEDGLMADAETVLEKLVTIEREMELTDGRFFLMRISPYRTDEDRIQGVVLSFIDITQRRVMEAQARQLNARLQRAMDAGKIFTWEMDPETQSFSFSDNTESVLGFDLPAQIMQNPAGNNIHPDDVEEATGKTARAVQSGEPYEHTARFVNPQTGKVTWVFSKGGLVTTAEGQQRFVGVAQDVTESKEAEEALRQSEEKYRMLFNSIDEGYLLVDVIFDDNGRAVDIAYLEANPAAHRLTGKPGLVGLRMSDVERDFDPSWAEVYGQVALSGEPLRMEYRAPDRSAERWFDFHISRVEDASGRRVAVVFQDITERRRSEQQLRRAAALDAFRVSLVDALRPLTDPIEIQAAAAHLLGETLQASRAFYAEARMEAGAAVLVAERDYHVPGAQSMAGRYPPESFNIPGQDARSGQPLVVTDLEADPRATEEERAAYRRVNIRAFIVVPIIKGDILQGCFSVHQAAPRAWTDDETALVEETADRTWAAVERARTGENLREAEALMRAMVDNLPGGAVFVIGRDMRYLLAGGETLATMGIKAEDFMGKGLGEATEAELVKTYMPFYEQALHGAGFSYELEAQGHYFLTQGVPLRNAAGEVYAVLAVSYDITSRIKAEGRLRESEERLRTLADEVPQIIWTNDMSGKADYFNRRWYEYSGLSPEESIGPGWQAIVHPQDAETSISRWHEAFARGKVFDAEYRLKRAGGDYRWFIGRNVPLQDERGQVVSWFGTATDIQDLKEAEEALRSSEERLRITMESASDYAIITTDTEGLITEWSRGAEQIFGYSSEEAIGQPTHIIFTPEDIAAGAPEHEMQTAKERGYANDERWHIRRDGARFYMSGVMRAIREGGLTGYVKIAREMTKQQQAQESLRITEERYRIALQSAEMGAWDWDLVTNRVAWNDQHFTMLGTEPMPGELDPAFFLSFIHPDDVARVRAGLEEATGTTGHYQAVFRIIRRDNGETRWMSDFGRAVTREGTRALRMAGVIYDITNQKILEQQKDEFIGIASHELRTPVTSIKAYAEVLQDMFEESGDTKHAGLMKKMDTQVDRLTELIRTLLDVTKLQEGKLEFRLEAFDLNALVTEEAETAQLATKHRIELHTRQLGEVMGDRERIRQVVMNLISNALKYSPGADRIMISTAQQEGEAMVCVQDFGIGMSEEVQAQVFNRFYRSEENGMSTFPGLGLGLYISAEFVKRHGGRLWVESEKGTGSTCCFSLPAGAQQQAGQ